MGNARTLSTVRGSEICISFEVNRCQRPPFAGQQLGNVACRRMLSHQRMCDCREVDQSAEF